MSRIVTELRCPKCGCERFLAGPRGAAARNVKCAECGYWMNVTIIPRTIPGTEQIVAGGFWITDEQGLDEIKKLGEEKQMTNLKCPCCGKELYQLAGTDVFAEQLTRALREHPEDIGELILGMFTIMHNPEAGEPLSDEERKELGLF